MDENDIKKSSFHDFLNRYREYDFKSFLARSQEDVDFINWHGYCLTMAYDDEKTEYHAVRNTCAIFDASPVKKYRITGTDAGAFLDAVMTRRISRQKPMRVSYAVFCNEDGMLLDDGLLYKFSEDNYLLMVSEVDHDRHFAGVSNRFDDLKIEEITPSLSGLALQGPKSCAVLHCCGFAAIENLKPYEIKTFAFAGSTVIVARVGFTADLGYELWFKPELNKAVEQALSDAETALNIKIAGYGLKALQALRLEGGFIVPGWDTAQTFEDNKNERTPAELGLSWTVDLDRRDDFIGKAALLREKENGLRFQMTGFTIDQALELEDGLELYATIDGDVLQVGTLPSVAWSYGLNCWLGLASIRFEFAGRGLNYHVEIAGSRIACLPVKLPFVRFDRNRQVPAPR